MKKTALYSIRDRLLDYFMQPWPADDDKHAMFSVAATINNPESKDGIALAPHHFEVWRLLTLDEEGKVDTDESCGRVLVCDCGSLVRTGIREKDQPGRTPSQGTPHKSPPDAPRSYGGTDPYNSADAHTPHAEARPTR